MSEGLGIGFAIGSSPIGTPPWNYNGTILSQYANSPTILGLINSMSSSIDPSSNIDNFYDYVWNLETAQGFGLDIWGRILGIGRVYAVPSGLHFGFDEASSDGTVGVFNEGIFWSAVGGTTSFSLSDTAYRLLLFAKAYANITDCTIPKLNRLLTLLFPGRGNAYVIDNNNMSMDYNFTFPLSQVEVTVVFTSGVLPHPAGVAVNVVFP